MRRVFSSLDRVDIVYTDLEGRDHWLQSDHRSPEAIEAEAELSLVFALIRVLNPPRDFPEDEPEPVLEYRCQHRPPDFMRAAIASAGAQLVVDEAVPYEDEAPDAETLADLGFAALAARVLAEHELPCELASLERLEREQPELRREADEIGYWRAVVSLAAVAGEVLRAEAGGRWSLHPSAGTLPFVFLLGPESAPVVVNPLGKAIKRLENGPEDSLASLVTVARRLLHTQ